MANNDKGMKALASSSTSYTQTLKVFFPAVFMGATVIQLQSALWCLISLSFHCQQSLHVVTMATASIVSIMLSFAHI